MKRKERRKRKKKKLINVSIIIIIFGIITWIQFEEYEENNVQDEESTYESRKLSVENNNSITIRNELEKEKIISKNKVQETYRDYPVVAKLEIPKIELETYVLQECSEETLNVSVTKFWGAGPNEIGNFCIAGHNFKNKNMFHNLKKLEVGDRIFIEDNKTRKNRV